MSGVEADPAAVEATLARCIERAKAAGVAIVRGSIAEKAPDGRLLGCCAIGAYDVFAAGDERVRILGRDMDVRYDIEAGFDERPSEAESTDWYAVGARLRERYHPVAFSTLGGDFGGAP